MIHGSMKSGEGPGCMIACKVRSGQVCLREVRCGVMQTWATLHLSACTGKLQRCCLAAAARLWAAAAVVASEHCRLRSLSSLHRWFGRQSWTRMALGDRGSPEPLEKTSVSAATTCSRNLSPSSMWKWSPHTIAFLVRLSHTSSRMRTTRRGDAHHRALGAWAQEQFPES